MLKSPHAKISRYFAAIAKTLAPLPRNKTGISVSIPPAFLQFEIRIHTLLIFLISSLIGLLRLPVALGKRPDAADMDSPKKETGFLDKASLYGKILKLKIELMKIMCFFCVEELIQKPFLRYTKNQKVYTRIKYISRLVNHLFRRLYVLEHKRSELNDNSYMYVCKDDIPVGTHWRNSSTFNVLFIGLKIYM